MIERQVYHDGCNVQNSGVPVGAVDAEHGAGAGI